MSASPAVLYICMLNVFRIYNPRCPCCCSLSVSPWIEGGGQEGRNGTRDEAGDMEEEAEMAEAKENLRLLQLQTLKYSTLWLIFQVIQKRMYSRAVKSTGMRCKWFFRFGNPHNSPFTLRLTVRVSLSTLPEGMIPPECSFTCEA